MDGLRPSRALALGKRQNKRVRVVAGWRGKEEDQGVAGEGETGRAMRWRGGGSEGRVSHRPMRRMLGVLAAVALVEGAMRFNTGVGGDVSRGRAAWFVAAAAHGEVVLESASSRGEQGDVPSAVELMQERLRDKEEAEGLGIGLDAGGVGGPDGSGEWAGIPGQGGAEGAAHGNRDGAAEDWEDGDWVEDKDEGDDKVKDAYREDSGPVVEKVDVIPWAERLARDVAYRTETNRKERGSRVARELSLDPGPWCGGGEGGGDADDRLRVHVVPYSHLDEGFASGSESTADDKLKDTAFAVLGTLWKARCRAVTQSGGSRDTPWNRLLSEDELEMKRSKLGLSRTESKKLKKEEASAESMTVPESSFVSHMTFTWGDVERLLSFLHTYGASTLRKTRGFSDETDTLTWQEVVRTLAEEGWLDIVGSGLTQLDESSTSLREALLSGSVGQEKLARALGYALGDDHAQSESLLRDTAMHRLSQFDTSFSSTSKPMSFEAIVDVTGSKYDAQVVSVPLPEADEGLRVVPLATAWQVDSYGHSPLTFRAARELGFKRVVLNRVSQAEKSARGAEGALDFLWDDTENEDGADEGNATPIRGHILANGYSSPPGLSGLTTSNPSRVGASKVLEWARAIEGAALKAEHLYGTKGHVLILVGGNYEFRGTRAMYGYANLNTVLEHLAATSTKVCAGYSTVDRYFDAVEGMEAVDEEIGEVLAPRPSYFSWANKGPAERPNDGFFFPFAESFTSVWSGLYANRPRMKQLRVDALSDLGAVQALFAVERLGLASGSAGGRDALRASHLLPYVPPAKAHGDESDEELSIRFHSQHFLRMRNDAKGVAGDTDAFACMKVIQSARIALIHAGHYELATGAVPVRTADDIMGVMRGNVGRLHWCAQSILGELSGGGTFIGVRERAVDSAILKEVAYSRQELLSHSSASVQDKALSKYNQALGVDGSSELYLSGNDPMTLVVFNPSLAVRREVICRDLIILPTYYGDAATEQEIENGEITSRATLISGGTEDADPEVPSQLLVYPAEGGVHRAQAKRRVELCLLAEVPPLGISTYVVEVDLVAFSSSSPRKREAVKLADEIRAAKGGSVKRKAERLARANAAAERRARAKEGGETFEDDYYYDYYDDDEELYEMSANFGASSAEQCTRFKPLRSNETRGDLRVGETRDTYTLLMGHRHRAGWLGMFTRWIARAFGMGETKNWYAGVRRIGGQWIQQKPVTVWQEFRRYLSSESPATGSGALAFRTLKMPVFRILLVFSAGGVVGTLLAHMVHRVYPWIYVRANSTLQSYKRNFNRWEVAKEAAMNYGIRLDRWTQLPESAPGAVFWLIWMPLQAIWSTYMMSAYLQGSWLGKRASAYVWPVALVVGVLFPYGSTFLLLKLFDRSAPGGIPKSPAKPVRPSSAWRAWVRMRPVQQACAALLAMGTVAGILLVLVVESPIALPPSLQHALLAGGASESSRTAECPNGCSNPDIAVVLMGSLLFLLTMTYSASRLEDALRDGRGASFIGTPSKAVNGSINGLTPPTPSVGDSHTRRRPLVLAALIQLSAFFTLGAFGGASIMFVTRPGSLALPLGGYTASTWILQGPLVSVFRVNLEGSLRQGTEATSTLKIFNAERDGSWQSGGVMEATLDVARLEGNSEFAVRYGSVETKSMKSLRLSDGYKFTERHFASNAAIEATYVPLLDFAATVPGDEGESGFGLVTASPVGVAVVDGSVELRIARNLDQVGSVKLKMNDAIMPVSRASTFIRPRFRSRPEELAAEEEALLKLRSSISQPLRIFQGKVTDPSEAQLLGLQDRAPSSSIDAADRITANAMHFAEDAFGDRLELFDISVWAKDIEAAEGTEGAGDIVLQMVVHSLARRADGPVQTIKLDGLFRPSSAMDVVDVHLAHINPLMASAHVGTARVVGSQGQGNWAVELQHGEVANIVLTVRPLGTRESDDV